MDTPGELRRRERLLAVARWAALAVGAAVLVVDRLAEGGGLDLRLEPAAPLVLAALAVVAVAVELGLRRLDDPARLRAFGDAVGVADGLVAVAAVTVVPYGAANAQDAILVLVVLEGAWRRNLPGAVAGWGASAAVLAGRALLAPPDALVGIPAVSLAYRLGLLLVVAVFAGVSQRRLADARRELENVHRATRAVAAPLDTAEILQAACREAAGRLRAQSAVLYAHDGTWFHPVAGHPTAELAGVLRADEHELEDPREADRLLREPTWLPPDGRRPGRLAVPVRWHTDEAVHLLVVRPRRRPSPWQVRGLAALAESTALALATTRVLAAEQRSVRRLRNLEALRTRFVATVAHDLRLPLTVFTGVSRLLRDRREAIDPARIDAMLASVERQAKRLSRLADDLLDAARIDSERFELRCDDIDLRDVVAATVADSEEEVAVSLDGDLRLVADAARLERVVWNLLSNAEKYGRPPFEVGAARRGGTIELVVRDHGSGLDAAARARLFADFAGSDDAASVGLGLAIVWQLVTAHGGTVTYRDAGPGACFAVALPAAGPPRA